MSKVLLSGLFLICHGLRRAIYGQDAKSKTDELITALTKTKYKKKDKKNVSVETYVDFESEAVVEINIRDYSGVYESGSDYRLELRVSADAKAEVNGFDLEFNNPDKRNFTFGDGQINGVLLTATKVFENSETVKFEAVFNNHTVIQGKNPNEIENSETKFVLGFIQTGAGWTSRVFLEIR